MYKWKEQNMLALLECIYKVPCNDDNICSGTLGQQANTDKGLLKSEKEYSQKEYIVYMLPKVQPLTIVSTNIPNKKKKIAKQKKLQKIWPPSSQCPLPSANYQVL